MPQPDPTILDGYGVHLRYAGSYLKVTWEHGGEVTIRQDNGAVVSAHVDHRPSADGFVRLQVRAHLTRPGPGDNTTSLDLSFPLRLAADVQRLADRINSDRPGPSRISADLDVAPWVNGGRPGAESSGDHRPGGEAPGQERRDPAEPDGGAGEPDAPRARPRRLRPPQAAGAPPAPPPAAAHQAQLPLVVFRVDPSAWADDPDWIGLCPPRETTRLMELPRPEPAGDHGSPPPPNPSR